MTGNFKIRRIVKSDIYEGTSVTIMSTGALPVLEVGKEYVLTFTPVPDPPPPGG